MNSIKTIGRKDIETGNPYSPPNQGIFNNQGTLDTSIPGKYSVYVPSSFLPYSPAVWIFGPDNISSAAFIEGEIGQAWVSYADENGIALIVAEPYEGGQWNLTNAVSMRDDDIYLKALQNTILQKFNYLPAAFDLDERSLYLVGYQQGGSAAHKFAMMWPQLLAGVVSIGGSEVSESIISSYSSTTAFPWAQSQNSDGKEVLNIQNSSIPLPAWIIGSTSGSEAVKQHWITSAGAQPGPANEYADETYVNGEVKIWYSQSDANITPSVLYEQFLKGTLRFAHEPGGKLEPRINFTNNGMTGFFASEMEVDGYLRHWLTYIPSTYDASQSYPLIIGLHGGSNVGDAFAGDSRWHEAAEKYGLIVVYPTAFPCELEMHPGVSWISTPVWSQGIPAPSNAPDDVAFIKKLIQFTKENYSIDASRVYATGHSSGGGMTWRLGMEAPEQFTAIAPAGYTLSGNPDNQAGVTVAEMDVPLPIWVVMGRYDAIVTDIFEEGNYNDLCVKYWTGRYGIDANVLTTKYDEEGRFFTRTWTNGKDDIPLFRYTTVNNLPHIYTPVACGILWEQYFSKITMDENGNRYFEGQAIT